MLRYTHHTEPKPVFHMESYNLGCLSKQDFCSQAESSRIQQTPHNHADTDFQKLAQPSPLYYSNRPSSSNPTDGRLSPFSILALASASPHEIYFPHLDSLHKYGYPSQFSLPFVSYYTSRIRTTFLQLVSIT